MKTQLYKHFTIFLFLFTGFAGYAQWNYVEPGIAAKNNVFFSDINHGWVAADDSTIIRTQDGGLTWEIHNVGTNGKYKSTLLHPDNVASIHTGSMYNTISFINGQQGWVGGVEFYMDENFQNFWVEGTLLYTNDGGDSWDFLSDETFPIIEDMVFLDENTGFFIFYTYQIGSIAKTDDGGNSFVDLWHNASVNYTPINSLNFADNQNGYAALDDGLILKTTDGGLNWVTEQIADVNLNSIFFINANIGWVVGNNGKIYKSEDGGNNWTEQASNTSVHLFDCKFISENRGWIAGDMQTVLFTDDGGSSWNTQLDSTNGTFEHISIIDANNCWITGYNQDGDILLNTTNGGITNISNTIGNNETVVSCYPNPFIDKTLIQVTNPGSDVIQIEIYNSNGTFISSFDMNVLKEGNSKFEYSATDQKPGIYFFIIKTSKAQRLLKLVKSE